MIRITNPKRFFVFLLAIIIVFFVAYKLVWGSSLMAKSGEITVAAGQSAGSVARGLVDQGFMSRVLPWRFYSWRSGTAAKIKAGTYHVEKGERVPEIISRMVAGDTLPDELTITYPEGFTLEQMAERTAAHKIGTKEEFIEAANPDDYMDRYPYLRELANTRTLEGYLFPDTYQVFPDDESVNVVDRMLNNFDRKVTEDLRQEAAQASRKLDQVIIMASIIERESMRDDDKALISGILWKRLDTGAGLAADATLRYVLKKSDGALTAEDLAWDSPYNTRKYRGLPPGPISNPGLKAILAATHPEKSDYYYYLHTPDGQTMFAKTNDEHNRNKAKYLK